ncbi:hypothetical protein JD844_031010 [Phrynosoma platyrhinos]|uniref:Uncharacterized protein n=1 Tax=Phrynosoma platyrhinos TaxID=52577 RepID=A0ABQ7T0D6_PHRPL|nr:hypothetical protein JD844_031010 [Phrynosoma platyrhinos]
MRLALPTFSKKREMKNQMGVLTITMAQSIHLGQSGIQLNVSNAGVVKMEWSAVTGMVELHTWKDAYQLLILKPVYTISIRKMTPQSLVFLKNMMSSFVPFMYEELYE